MALAVAVARLAQVQSAYPAIVAGFDPVMKCARSDGPSLPSLPWLEACIQEAEPKHEVSLAMDSGTPAGLMVVHLVDSRISWLVANSAFVFGDVVNAFTTFAKARYGRAWGRVAGAGAQAAFLATGLYTLDPVTHRLDRS